MHGDISVKAIVPIGAQPSVDRGLRAATAGRSGDGLTNRLIGIVGIALQPRGGEKFKTGLSPLNVGPAGNVHPGSERGRQADCFDHVGNVVVKHRKAHSRTVVEEPSLVFGFVGRDPFRLQVVRPLSHIRGGKSEDRARRAHIRVGFDQRGRLIGDRAGEPQGVVGMWCIDQGDARTIRWMDFRVGIHP